MPFIISAYYNRNTCDSMRRIGTPRGIGVNKYVRIRKLLTKLQTPEDTTVKTHRNREMAN